MRAALTCGTDLKTYLRGHPKFPTPTLFGHEFSGELAEVGADVRGLREGDAVMAAPTAPCGACYHCEREQENLCEQVMDHVRARRLRRVHQAARRGRAHQPVPQAARRCRSPRRRCSSRWRACCTACRTSGCGRTIPCVLVGAGAIALLHLLVLRARGVERRRGRWRAARRARRRRAALGRDGAAQSTREAAREPVLELTGGRGADVVIECTGQVGGVGGWRRSWRGAAGRSCCSAAARRARRCASTPRRLHYDQVAVTSPFHFTPRDVRAPYELLSGGDVRRRRRWWRRSTRSSGSRRRSSASARGDGAEVRDRRPTVA